MKIKTGIKSGGIRTNENQTLTAGPKVRSGIKGGVRSGMNENQTLAKPGVKIRSSVKAGARVTGGNENPMKIKTGIKSGGFRTNENQTVAKSGTKVRSGVKGGRLSANKNETLASARRKR